MCTLLGWMEKWKGDKHEGEKEAGEGTKDNGKLRCGMKGMERFYLRDLCVSLSVFHQTE